MLIFLYGSDAYRLKEAKQNIIKEYRKKYSSGMNVFDFDLSDAGNLERLINTVKSSSFFSEHKLIALSNVFAKKLTADKVIDIVNKYGISSVTDTTLLFSEPSHERELIAKSKDLFTLVNSKSSLVKTFNPLDGASLSRWIQKEFELRNCSINLNALNKLITVVGNDSWALINEIEKLAAYRQRGEVSIEDVGLLVNQTKELNIFDLMDAIASRNSKRSIELLYLNLASSADPYYLMSMITGQFRNLLSIKDLNENGFSQVEIVKKTGLHPFVVRKTQAQINNFRIDELKIKYKNLLEIDVNAKRGGGLENYLYGLILN